MDEATAKRRRIHTWLNSETWEPMFGIQTLHKRKWMHTCDGTTPLLYSTVEEAEAKIEALSSHSALRTAEGREG